jgi:hypothetical protein
MGKAVGKQPSTTNNEAELQRQEEQQRQQRVRDGTTRIGEIFGSNFTDDFYRGRRQSYLDFATPQIEQQYADAQKALTFALDRTGTLDSSIRGSRMSDLQRLYDTHRQSVADQALSYENDARSRVEDARSGLIGTLNATGDAEGAANMALTRAAALSAPPAYNPLSNLFADFTAGLGQQAQLERAGALSGGAFRGRYNTGLFAPSSGAVRVT